MEPEHSTVREETGAVLFADVVESSIHAETDERGFVARWRSFFRRACLEGVEQFGGTMIKGLGDGFRAIFPTARAAIRSAEKIRDLCREERDEDNARHPLLLRIGIHYGTFLRDDLDIYGTVANLTERLSKLAINGGIVCSDEIKNRLIPEIDGDFCDLNSGLDPAFSDLGNCFVRNRTQTVHAYSVSWAEDNWEPPAATPSSMKWDDHIVRASIAVVPFTLRSVTGESRSEAAFGDIIADDIIASLARISSLRVISRLSAAALKSADADQVPHILRRLAVQYVVSGTCRIIGDSIIVRMEVMETASGSVVWPFESRSSARATLAGEDPAAHEIASTIARKIMNREALRTEGCALPTIDSHSLLLGSMALLHQNSEFAMRTASTRLAHLVERHPRHPLPYAWLAKCHVLEAAQGWCRDRSRASQRGLDAARRALDADPQCAFALALKGQVHAYLLKQMDEAAWDYSRALELNPNESLAWLYKATWHAWNDEGQQAIEAADRALGLSPLDPVKYYYDSLAATCHLVAGNYTTAVQLASRSAKANANHSSTFRMLAVAQIATGDGAAARRSVDRLRALEPTLSVSGFLRRYPGSESRHAGFFSSALAEAGLPP